MLAGLHWMVQACILSNYVLILSLIRISAEYK